MENIKMKYNDLLNKINTYTNFILGNVLKWNLEIMVSLKTEENYRI